MSRATTTPARTGLPTPTASRLSLAASQSGLPTPSRRPRSSLGPNSAAPIQDPDLQSAYQDLKRGPRPSINSSVSSPAAVGPRTPAARARTPSLYQSQNAPITPRPMLGSRPSLGPSTPGQTGMFTPKRPARPESRASTTSTVFRPQVGDAVRMSNMGSEGVLRFVGETEFKEGVWAGVELGGGFKGKGKNDGSVNGKRYFDADPNCGVFVLYSKLSPPTAVPSSSRPASVASSHRSNLSMSGRATPSGTRSVSRASSRFDDEPMPTRLMASTASTASTSSALTEGSRASRLANMTAKQLLDREKAPASTTTPRAPRVSSARPRQSIGTAGFSTPKAKVSANMMPPPPSPSQFKALDEVRDLRARNAELEERLKAVESDAVRARASSRASLASRRIDGDEMAELRATLEDRDGRIGELEGLVDDVQGELAQVKAMLEDAEQRVHDAEPLKQVELELQASLEASRAELEDLRKEMKVQEERLVGELEAGMDRKRQEVAQMEARAIEAEAEVADLKAFADELTDAGQATISLYEAKLSDVNSTRYDLEATVRTLEEKLAKATAPSVDAPSSPATAQREATTAAEIDNENLTAQVKHLQNKLTMLEDELEEVRMQATNDAKAADARIAKAKDAGKDAKEEVGRVKEEKESVLRDGQRLKERISELEGALKENALALEGARAEIEGLRVEVADTESLRAGLRAGPSEDDHSAKIAEITQLKTKLQSALDDADARKQQVEAAAETSQEKISQLETEIAELQKVVNDLRQKAAADGARRPSTPAQNDDASEITGSPARELRNSVNSMSARKPRASAGPDADKSLRGFQHIIQELTNENAELKKTCEELREENQLLASDTALLRDEMKALEETLESSLLRQEGELDGQESSSSTKDLETAQAAAVEAERKNQRAISLLNRELAELESLVESKIYREAELESTISDLQRSNDKWKAKAGASAAQPAATTSNESAGDSTDRCELCEGDHDLDACPVFSGNLDNGSPYSFKKDKVWCQDCESSQHRTEDCPLAEDVF